MHAAWLDLREKGTTLVTATSPDGGRTWQPNRKVYESPEGTICQCCHPSVAVDAKGGVHLMWRNVMGGNRDMYVMNVTDAGARPEKQGEGAWPLNACPMDGGAFAVDPDGKVSSAWRRDSSVYLTERGAPEKMLGLGKDVAMVRNKRGSFVAWTKDTQVLVLTPEGAQPAVLGTGGFVNLVALRAGGAQSVLAAWESQGAIVTKVVE